MLMQLTGAVFIAGVALCFLGGVLLGLSWVLGLATDSIW